MSAVSRRGAAARRYNQAPSLSNLTFVGIAGTKYYIDNSAGGASDSNNGTSPATPWLTASKLGTAFAAGDTVFIKAGTAYSSAGITASILAVGTSLKPITVTKYGTGANPTIATTSAATFGTSPPLRMTSAARFITVDSMAVIRADHSYGVYLNGAQNCTVRYCEVSAAGQGVTLQDSSGILVAACYIHDLVMIVNDATSNNDTGAQAFSTLGTCSSLEVSFSYFKNCKATSIDYGFDGGAIETWQNVNGLNVHDNFADTCDGFLECGGNVNTQTAQNITVANNVMKNCGLASWLHDNTAATFGIICTNVAFSFNTIYNSAAVNVLWGAETTMSSTVTSTRNLMLSTGSFAVYYASGATVGMAHTNNFYQVGSTPTGTGETAGTITFTNPGADDFHTSGTPATYGAYANGGSPSATWPNPAYVVPNGVTVGAITSPGGSTLSLGGTYASLFQIVGSNLVTKGLVTAGSYDITITATPTSGSPSTINVTIVGSAGAAGTDNLIPGTTNVGAVVGNPGTLPTGWSYFQTGTLTTHVVGFGADDGFGTPYIDIRLNGSISVTPIYITVANTAPIVASTAYVLSLYLRTTAVVTTPAGYFTTINTDPFDTANTGYVAPSFSSSVTLSATRTRYNCTGTTGAISGTGNAHCAFQINGTIGQAIDITYRIAGVQLETGSAPTAWVA